MLSNIFPTRRYLYNSHNVLVSILKWYILQMPVEYVYFLVKRFYVLYPSKNNVKLIVR